MSKSIYDFKAKDAEGIPVPLELFRGEVLLIVNVASQCGFTPQYEGLEALFRKYQDRDFSILAFPCNQFGKQETGTDEEIQDFCKKNFEVSFPVFSKIEVNGAGADPLFRYLKKAAPGIAGTQMIKWNFTKFLVDRDGRVLKRFAPIVKPASISDDIENALKS